MNCSYTALSVWTLNPIFFFLPTRLNRNIKYKVLIEPLKQFAKDSMHLVKKCTKPDRKEFTALARAVCVGFFMMGFIGFFVKLIHIPINNILVGN
jgi:protein transport protein SEC61 subunit gamma and related proteins